jgi:diguanylate cyclase (GGDEF)-like protein
MDVTSHQIGPDVPHGVHFDAVRVNRICEMDAPIDNSVAHLYYRALELRASDDVEAAHRLLLLASVESTSRQSELWLRLRAMYLQSASTGHEPSPQQLTAVADEAAVEHLPAIEADARAALASHYFNERDTPRAIASMARAVSILQIADDAADLALPLSNVGVSSCDLGLVSTGREHLERALRLNTDASNAEFLKGSLGIILATGALQLDSTDPERRDLMERAIHLSNEALDNSAVLGELVMQVHCRQTRAVCLIALGHAAEAVADCVAIRAAIDELGHDPTRGDIEFIEGALHHRESNDRDALNHLARYHATDVLGRGLGVELEAMRVEAAIHRDQQDLDAAFAVWLGMSEHQLTEATDARHLRGDFLKLAVDLLNAQTLSLRDPLTGLPNRRALERDLAVLLSDDSPVVVAAIDLDHFKQINDGIGYQIGDRALQELGVILTRSLRRNDVVGRLGGDEFVVALRCADTERGKRRLDEIRRHVAHHAWGSLHPDLRVTASIGAVFGRPDDRETVDQWVVDASTALRAAKVAGRNTVTVG